eukprot:936578-Pelagomonas_calceolata.AAC.3
MKPLINACNGKAPGRAKWWKHGQHALVVKWKDKCSDLECTAKGKDCQMLLCVTNPTETATCHLTVKACKGLALLGDWELSFAAKRTATKSGTASTSKQPCMDICIIIQHHEHANPVAARARYCLHDVPPTALEQITWDRGSSVGMEGMDEEAMLSTADLEEGNEGEGGMEASKAVRRAEERATHMTV